MHFFCARMLVHNAFTRVRYGEVDQMGFLYYGNYALFFEIGRAEMIRHLGYTYAQMEKEGILMPVVKMQSKYLRPAQYDDLIRIETTVKDLVQPSFITFHHKLYNESEELLHIGQVTLTFYGKKEEKRIPMPESLYSILIKNIKE